MKKGGRAPKKGGRGPLNIHNYSTVGWLLVSWLVGLLVDCWLVGFVGWLVKKFDKVKSSVEKKGAPAPQNIHD